MEEGKRIRVLTIRYTTDILYNEIPLFRGAVIAAMGDEANILFHNHIDDEKLRYSYPLIQYKRIGGKAAIVCVGTGTDIIGQFLATDSKEMMLGDRQVTIEIDAIMPRQMFVQTWQSNFTYYLNRWLPLNSENYQIYQQCDSMVERVQLLEKILIGNILSFAKGLGINISEQLYVKIKSLQDPYIIKNVRNKHVKLMAFNVEFVSNMSIPDNIGLGKNASLGYGIVNMRKEKRETNSNKLWNNRAT